MRSLSLHYGSIQIASVAGESRRVRVSGLSKARLFWLFRNFSILEFPVLSRQEQQLIYQMWNSGKRIPAKQDRRDVIGRIEAFSPQLCEKQAGARKPSSERVPARQSSTEQPSREAHAQAASAEEFPEKLCSENPGAPRTRFRLLRAGLRGAVSWRAFTILLLGAAMYLGPRYLPPKHSQTPQTQVATVGGEKQRTRSAPAASEALPNARSSAKPGAAQPAAASAAAVPVAAAPAAPGVAPVSPPAASASASDSRAISNAATALAAPDLPQAMAHEASMPLAPPPKARSVGDGRPQEVLIRVSVNAAGQAKSFAVLRGDQQKTSAALKAARLWNFKPCARGEACDQVLKFTDYGDSSRVQRIE